MKNQSRHCRLRQLGPWRRSGCKITAGHGISWCFSRRNGLETVSGVPSYAMSELESFKGKIDVYGSLRRFRYRLNRTDSDGG